MHVYGAARNVQVIAPNPVENFRAREHLIRCLCQQGENLEFGSRQSGSDVPVAAPAIRWAYLCRHLAQLGHDVEVLTIRGISPRQEAAADRAAEGIVVHRVFAGPFESIAFRTRAKMGLHDRHDATVRRRPLFRILKSGYWAARKATETLLPGNITTEWFPHAWRYLKEHLDLAAFDTLITSHEPWVDSLLGLRLKHAYPHLRWVADPNFVLDISGIMPAEDFRFF